ncbi:MAG: hypothetical protein K5910_01615 [Bacteroidales bacterium]|nr:hypothetical protein [Bacteroidales bacterium]
MKNFRLWFLSAAMAALLLPLPAAGQSICFWTDDPEVVPVRIYVDQEYLGDVTAAFAEQPLLDAEGALSIDTTPVRHSLTAVDKYGRVYKGWSGNVTPREGEVRFLRIRGNGFRQVNRDDYAFVFLDWVPLFPLPRYYRYDRFLDDLSPLEDQGLLVGMAATAVGATAAMGVAASRNWNVEDNRFPYVALGLGTEYFSTLHLWRNVAQFKARFGEKGGFSLLADAGYASYGYWLDEGAFTFSLGAGLDYGGFGFALRYKPALEFSYETFLAARAEYDWWITDHFALDFHAGFGVGGFGEKGLMDYYDFPFGFGLLFRL